MLYPLLFFSFHITFASECIFLKYETIDSKKTTLLERRELNSQFDQDIFTIHKRIKSENSDKLLKLKNLSETRSLKTISFNTGLLNRLFKLAYVPEYELRRNAFITSLGRYLEDQKPAFATLQEVWDKADVKAIDSKARTQGYTTLTPNMVGKTNPSGLQTLIRNDLANNIKQLNTIYMPQQLVERVARLKKAIFPVIVTLSSGLKVMIINSHFAYSPQKTSSRLRQARILSEYIKNREDQFDYLIVGMDTNSSDRFDLSFDSLSSEWYKDKMVYLGLSESTQQYSMRDTFMSVDQHQPGFTQDPVKNAITRLSPTTKNEPSQRLDYIYAGSTKEKQFAVTSSRLIFDKPLTGNSNLFLSDHFGIESTILIHNEKNR